MKRTSLELQHIDYFIAKGSILFQDIIPEKKLHAYKLALCFFQKRSARNCWSSHPEIKKLSFSPALASIALQLAQTKSLRFGYDHLFSSLNELKDFFKTDLPLSKISSIDGLEIAALINLSMAPPPDFFTSSFPFGSASGCFFDPKRLLDLSQVEQAEGPFFLITYCKPQARYIHQSADPFTHLGKQEGLVFGDLLSPEFHPLLHTH
jgi:hypothetical protein